MKRKIHILMSALLMSFIIASCGSGRMIHNPEMIEQEKNHCGFGDGADAETTNEEVKTNTDVQITERAAPAAERGNKLPKESTGLENDQDLASTADTEESAETTENKIKRSDAKVGAKKKKKFKQIVKAVKEYKKNKKRESGAMLVLLIILAIILPPLAVGIYEGITGRFWLVLVLWLVGIGIGWWLLGPGIGWLCSLVAVVMALLIVLAVW